MLLFLKTILELIFQSFSVVYIKEKEKIMVVLFWDFLMFDQILLSVQEKWNVIISNKHGIYDLPDDSGLKLLAN